MRKLLLLLLLVSVPYQVKGAEQCPNLEGLWSTHASGDINTFRQRIDQTKCESLNVTKYAPNDHSVELITFTVNDVWNCENGTSERLECHKAKWTESNVIITRVRFEEGCLSVHETYLENAETLRTDTKASCPGDVKNFGYGTLRLRRVDKR